ncbi:MAG: hypothetical protein KDD48_03070 [Bdellovibrionales bacterium]|nr:hypothetical protein [Bdellovibrionales bacterium]
MKLVPLLGIGIIFCSLFFRVVYESKRNLEMGKTYEQDLAYVKAILSYDQAAHWYFPGNPYVKDALNRLYDLGCQLEEKQPDLAVWAFDSVRGSIYSTRSVFIPHRAMLEKVNAKIANLRALEDSRLNSQLSVQDARSYHLDLLKDDSTRGLGWSILVELSFFSWIASTVGLIWKGFSPSGEMKFQSSLPWVFGIILSFTLWIVGLTRA